MPTFEFEARNPAGIRQTGEISAGSRAAATAQLQSRGLTVTRVVPVVPEAADAPRWPWLIRARPSSVELEVTLQQLSILLRNGTTLLTAISSLAQSSSSAGARRLWQDIAQQLQAGNNLSTALERQRYVPEFVSLLVAVGEKTGQLDPVLWRSAQTLKNRRQARTEVMTAVFYPFLVVVMAVAVTMYMVIYLIPRLERYLLSLGKTIPAMTQYLIDGSQWLRENYVAVLAGIAIVAIAGAMAYVSREGRYWIDRVSLSVPIVGPLTRLRDTAQFSRTMSMLIGSGVSLTDSLRTVERLIHNRFIGTIVTTARDKIIQGHNLSKAIEQTNSFTPMLNQMIAVGEQSGDLEGVLRETAEFHEELLRSRVRRLNAILTPCLTLLVGIVVGYVYIAFFLALFAAAA